MEDTTMSFADEKELEVLHKSAFFEEKNCGSTEITFDAPVSTDIVFHECLILKGAHFRS